VLFVGESEVVFSEETRFIAEGAPFSGACPTRLCSTDALSPARDPDPFVVASPLIGLALGSPILAGAAEVLSDGLDAGKLALGDAVNGFPDAMGASALVIKEMGSLQNQEVVVLW